MATVADMMDEAADECSVTPPSSWATAATLTYRDLKRFLNDTANELLDRVDWPDPIGLDTIITGTGAEAYNLPSNFKRLTRDGYAVYETTTVRRPCIPVNTNGQWTWLKQMGSAGGDRYYRTAGDETDGHTISFFQNPATGISITCSYISKNWLKVAGTPGSKWSNDNATLLLPKELMQMGVVWRFRRRKGLPFADRLAEYEANLARLANDARGIRKVDMTGASRMRSPFDIPAPDFIPTA